ncbi:MAG: SUMF1/EgtB/PvdO family nonheme iron enzyme [Proteobacteria bacterium]|nr:SUMF1/EgtB/PvdO family nonheme iron enzyme [Pseudomonadota bacterium]
MKRSLLLILLAASLTACEFEETCPPEASMVKVADANGDYFYIDAYEASRTNATDAVMGTGVTMACNVKSVIPWYNVSYQDARNACIDAGKRLCTQDEWITACEKTYPYGSGYVAGTCNDGNGLESMPTGSLSGCKTASGIYDMSGNVREWVEGGLLMGGAYDSAASGVTCASALNHASDYYNYSPSSADGFRCCSSEKLVPAETSAL